MKIIHIVGSMSKNGTQKPTERAPNGKTWNNLRKKIFSYGIITQRIINAY
jgi:hypothetical protein